MAGPSGADQLVRHYSHDAWNSVSATIKLPVKGAVMGALAPILTPTETGERRSYVVSYPILRQSMAGGDFAAAIACGNPVIAKANSSHPGTTRLLAEEAHGDCR